MKTIGYAIVALVVLVVVFRVTSRSDLAAPPSEGFKPLVAAAPATPKCAPRNVTIKSMKAGFVDPCRRRACPSMKGVAVLTNGCPEAIGVQVKIVGLDAKGSPVSARDLWPASTQNIPPGDYTFSLDHYLDFDPQIRSFTIEPIRVQRW